MEQKSSINVKGQWTVECFGPNGERKWQESFDNLVTNAGVNYLLDAGLSGASPITSWYVGLKGSGTPVAGDTLTSHGSWSEVTPYSGNRLAWTEAGVSSKSITNSASPASFSITSSVTVHGAFLCSVASGTSGTLFSAGDFSSSKAVDNGDTLNVTYTISGDDDGV